MTNEETTEVEWEEIHDIKDLRMGDEVEYVRTNDHSEIKYWGEVLHISDYSVLLSGDWHLVDSSLNPNGFSVASIRRKVVPAKLPTAIGAVISYTWEPGDGTLGVTTYVRIDDRADKAVWVKASNGERWAEWELEILHKSDELTVVSEGP